MNSYFDNMVLGASPIELTRMLYQKAISKVRDAREHLRRGRIEERSAAITWAYRVLAELSGSLDRESAPELSAKLAALYSYVQERLLEANMQQRDEPLAEVLNLLLTLAEAWQGIPDAQEVSPAQANPWAAMQGSEESGRWSLTA